MSNQQVQSSMMTRFHHTILLDGYRRMGYVSLIHQLNRQKHTKCFLFSTFVQYCGHNSSLESLQTFLSTEKWQFGKLKHIKYFIPFTAFGIKVLASLKLIRCTWVNTPTYDKTIVIWSINSVSSFWIPSVIKSDILGPGQVHRKGNWRRSRRMIEKMCDWK